MVATVVWLLLGADFKMCAKGYSFRCACDGV